MLLAETAISPSAGLVVGTIASLAMFALLGLVLLVVFPRHMSVFAVRLGTRRRPK
ncbi:MAG TPA: hypothetical protein VLB81_15940 [Gaiellales bacterium]|nr:hypothetical protein [Gaiellales bacterium]